MTTSLHPCPECHRHVRTTESACPFCGVALDATWASGAKAFVAPASGGVRLSRAALFAAGALTVAPTACSTTVTPVYGAPDGWGGETSTGGAGTGGENSIPIYGGPPTGGSAGELNAGGAGGETAGEGGALPGPVYGLPPGQ